MLSELPTVDMPLAEHPLHCPPSPRNVITTIEISLPLPLFGLISVLHTCCRPLQSSCKAPCSGACCQSASRKREPCLMCWRFKRKPSKQIINKAVFSSITFRNKCTCLQVFQVILNSSSLERRRENALVLSKKKISNCQI